MLGQPSIPRPLTACFLAFLFAIGPLDLAVARAAYKPLPTVSLVSLIAAPEQFDGKRVVVIGFGTFRFEDLYIYLTPYDAEQGISENALALVLTAAQLKASYKLHHQIVQVEGTFHGSRIPNQNGYIDQITHVLLRDPRNPYNGL